MYSTTYSVCSLWSRYTMLFVSSRIYPVYIQLYPGRRIASNLSNSVYEIYCIAFLCTRSLRLLFLPHTGTLESPFIDQTTSSTSVIIFLVQLNNDQRKIRRESLFIATFVLFYSSNIMKQWYGETKISNNVLPRTRNRSIRVKAPPMNCIGTIRRRQTSFSHLRRVLRDTRISIRRINREAAGSARWRNSHE